MSRSRRRACARGDQAHYATSLLGPPQARRIVKAAATLVDASALALGSLVRERPRGGVDVTPMSHCPPSHALDHCWGSRLFEPVGRGAPQVQGVRRNFLVGSDHLDELSGMPNLNGTAVALQADAGTWRTTAY